MVNIKKQLENLAKCHDKNIQVYGSTNFERLSGAHETSPIDQFSWGVANRGASVRVPRTTFMKGCGY
jgi:glutamine synthetase